MLDCATPPLLQGNEVASNSNNIRGEQVGVVKSTGEGGKKRRRRRREGREGEEGEEGS